MIKKHILEVGRSMTEMLGTLAIIGVLSVGAIGGYNYAMDKHRANETIKDVTLYAMSASQQMLAGQEEWTFSELGNGVSTMGYPIEADILEEDDRYFEIYVDGVPSSVCERIVDTGWNVPLVIYVNDVAYVDSNHICDADGNETPVDMAFQFTADLNAGALPFGTCETASDCIGNCATCEGGLCVSACKTGEMCLKSSTTGNMMCCSAENKSGPYCCPSTKNGMCCDESGEKCCPWNRPLADKNGNCYACDNGSGVDVKGVEDNCNVCGNREVAGTSCVLKCPADKPLRDRDGKCFGCDDPAGHAMLDSTVAQCALKCPERHLVRHYCSIKCEDGYVQNTYGDCVKCEDIFLISNWGAPTDLCSQCGPDYVQHKSSACYKKCPQENQMRSSDGTCHDCDDPNIINTPLISTADGYCTSMCSNRITWPYYASNSAYTYQCVMPCADGEYMDWDGLCHNCEMGPNKKATAAECAKCPNRRRGTTGTEKNLCIADCGDNEFRGADGLCYSCDEPTPIKYSGQCTEQCSNRVVNGKSGVYCSVKCAENYFANDMGECVPCDADYAVELYGQSYARAECEKCGDTRNLYYSTYTGYICTPKCPAETPLWGMDGTCYTCDTEKKVYMGSGRYVGICETECPDERKMEGNYCVLK